MAKKVEQNQVQNVTIVEARLTMWGTAVNRSRLLTQELVKLGKHDLADKAKALFDECVSGYNSAYEDATDNAGNPALG